MEFPEGTVGSGSSIAAAVAQVTDVTWVWYPWPGNFIMPQVWRCEVENVLWGWKCAVKLKILCAECGISDFSKPFLYLLLFFKRWSLVDLQCFNFCYTAEYLITSLYKIKQFPFLALSFFILLTPVFLRNAYHCLTNINKLLSHKM